MIPKAKLKEILGALAYSNEMWTKKAEALRAAIKAEGAPRGVLTTEAINALIDNLTKELP